MPAFDKVNWRRITAEASAIALGVFLSLWADEWRSSRADAADGRAALVRIASDLERDTAALVGLGRSASRQVQAIREILTADPEDPGAPQLIAERVPHVVVSAGVTVSRSEYDALISSGRLGLVGDADLLADLARFYAMMDYLVAISDEEHQQRRTLAALLHPHIEWPRDRFLLPSDSGFLPTPTAKPSVVGLLADGTFVGQMAHMGTLKEIKAQRSSEFLQQARTLIGQVNLAAGRRDGAAGERP